MHKAYRDGCALWLMEVGVSLLHRAWNSSLCRVFYVYLANIPTKYLPPCVCLTFRHPELKTFMSVLKNTERRIWELTRVKYIFKWAWKKKFVSVNIWFYCCNTMGLITLHWIMAVIVIISSVRSSWIPLPNKLILNIADNSDFTLKKRGY